jgi:prophage regulatory protein
METKPQAAPKIIRRKQVEARIGLSRTTIYQQLKDGTFPRPINLGPRAVGWIESEVDAWVDAHIQKSRRAQGAQP